MLARRGRLEAPFMAACQSTGQRSTRVCLCRQRGLRRRYCILSHLCSKTCMLQSGVGNDLSKAHRRFAADNTRQLWQALLDVAEIRRGLR